MTNITALFLRPDIVDISQFALFINYCFLLARYHIWHMASRPANTSLSLSDFRCKFEVDPRPLSFYGWISAVESLRNDSNFQDLQNSNYEYEPLKRRSKEDHPNVTLFLCTLKSKYEKEETRRNGCLLQNLWGFN